jgi:ketosteroid isomerase-like protein
MTSRDEMVETIMRAYKAREEGNIEGLMATFHPNAVFELKGDKSMLEVAGTVEGHANVRAALSQFAQFAGLSRITRAPCINSVRR